MTARQAPSGEKWDRLSGEIQATARTVPIHHPLERCCPPGLEPTHMLKGARSAVSPVSPAAPADGSAGLLRPGQPGGLHVEE